MYTHIMCLQANQCVCFFSSQLSKPFILAVQCQNHQCAELLITRYRGMVSTYAQVCIYMQVQPTIIITYLKVPIAQHTQELHKKLCLKLLRSLCTGAAA